MDDIQCLSHTKWDCKEDMCEQELQRDAFPGTRVFCVNGRHRRRSRSGLYQRAGKGRPENRANIAIQDNMMDPEIWTVC